MKLLDEEEKKLGGRSFISEDLGCYLMGLKSSELNDTRLLYLKRAGFNFAKLAGAYQKQQELIERYKEQFIKDENPEIEDQVPPMVNGLLNPLLVEIYTSEEEIGKYILDKIT
ncbi:hypothetical protein [Flammeovirga pacifica]|uniref:Uncharacterized protein n=1 Tax=Flammeovirga pacifica TaxID=915059 RepID=A0A1S1Z045_FLAPC|nr:hypothetical protein [Flammeovirga pacifica]OHX66553.1 hypothetical protein NH26_09375 [Flammeovirga pacifica]